MSENVIKVALYEDNDILRTSLTHLLQSSQEFEFASSFASLVAILEKSREHTLN